MRGHPRQVDVRNVVARPSAQPAPVLRIAYDEEHYADAEDAITGIRERMLQGWRVAVVRGPSAGPFVIVYQREVPRER